MVSDGDIGKQIQILLTQSHPKPFTTLNDVVNHLSQKLGFNLSHKSPFISDQINLLHLRQSQSQSHSPPPSPSASSPVTTSAIPKEQSPFQYPQFYCNQQQQQQQQPKQQQPHYVLRRHRDRQRHPIELNFSNPTASPPPPEYSQVQALPDVEKLNEGGTTKRGGTGGLNKLCGISPELQVIVGESSLSRADTVKKLWAYIRNNNLQDPSNKRKIICDDALRVVFETDCTDMFQMNKLLAKHIITLEPTKETSRKRSKVEFKVENGENSDIVPSQVVISEALANCLDTQEQEKPESEALLKT